MRSASVEYKRIMQEHIYNAAMMSVSLGIVNQEAQALAKMSGVFAYYSSPQACFDNKDKNVDYATLEPYWYRADGTMYLIPQQGTLPLNNYSITRDLMDSLSVKLDMNYDIKGLTIEFPNNGYPTRFSITDSNGDVKIYDNDTEYFTTEDAWFGVNSLQITPISFIRGDKRLKIKNLVLGVGIAFTDKEIMTAECVGLTNSIAEEGSYVDFSLTVENYENKFNVDNRESFINFLETGQALSVSVGLWLDDETIEWLLYGTFYLREWSSTREKMSFKASDRMSFMTDKYEKGNYIHERTLYQDAYEVLTDFGLEPDQFVIDEYLRDITISNPLPEVTHATCLQLIANAARSICYQNSRGQVVIRANFANVISPEDIEVTATNYAPYSTLSNVTKGAEIFYVDLTRDFYSADGTMYLLPLNQPYLETGFISRDVADDNGLFTTNPTLSLQLEAGYAYFGVSMVFGGNHPEKLIAHTYLNGENIENVEFDVTQNISYFEHAFKTFDKMTFEFAKAAPNDRVLVQKAGFSELSDYVLRRQDMMSNPVGRREERAKTVSVRVFSFYEDENGEPKEIKDSVYALQNVFTSGEEVVYENPLIGSQKHAAQIAKWIGNYYANNVSYSVDYRGEPRLEPADIIYMDSDYLSDLQVEIYKNTFRYNGTFGGSLELRRAFSSQENHL